MAAYDAEIRVKTKVDNGDVVKLEAVLNEAEKQADDLGDALKDVQLNRETAEAAQQAATAVNHLERETRKAAAAAGELEDAWKNTKIHLNDGSTLDWDENVIEEAVKDTAELNREQSGLADTAARAAEIMRRMGEETRQATDAVRGTDTADVEKELTPLQNMLAFIRKSFQDIPLLFGGIADKFTSKARRMQDEWDNLSNRADAYKRILKELESEDKGFGDSEYDEAYKEWQKAEQAVREYKKQLAGAKKQHINLIPGLKNLQKTVSGVFRKMATGVKKFFTSTQSGAKKTGGALGTMASRMKGLALSLLFFNWISKGFNAMVSGMKNGFKALSGYSREYASSVQTLKNALGTLGNSFSAAFAPIVQTVIPYLVELINWVTRAINAVAQLIAYLSGKGTWTKATEVQNGYNDALNGTASAAKKAAGALAKFDDLDVLQKKEVPSGGGGGGATDGGFEEVPIDSDIKKFADKLKDIFSKLFNPFKEAWEREGQFVMDSWKYALGEIWKLMKDIGRDFLTVWNQEATIQMFADILHIIGDIGLTVGNLARNFREAWNENETGLRILENIRDIFAAIIRNIRLAADETVLWSNQIDFSPLLQALEEWTRSLIPVAKELSGILKDFYSKVLLKLSKWAMEKGLPDLLQVFIDFNKKVNWSAIRKNLSKFWDKLEPFAETVGEGLIIFIGRLADGIAGLLNSEWFADLLEKIGEAISGIDAEDVADAIGTLIKMIIGLKAALVLLGGIIGAAEFVVGFAKFLEALTMIKEVLAGSKLVFAIQSVAGGAASLGEALQYMLPHLSSFLGFLASNPVIALVGGVAALVTIVWNLDTAVGGTFSNWVKKMDEASESSQNLSDKIEDQSQKISDYVNGAGADEIALAREMADRYQELEGKKDRTNAETEEMKQLALELAALIPGLNEQIDKETGLLDLQGTSLDALIEKTDVYYKMQAAKDKIVESYKLQMEALENVKESTDRVKEAEEQHRKAMEEMEAAYNNSNVAMDYASSQMDSFQNNATIAKQKLDEQKDTLEKAIEAYDKSTESIEFLRECMNDWSDDLSNVDYATFVVKTSNSIDEMSGLWEQGTDGWVQIVGEKALKIQDEIDKGLTPDENGIYTAANSTMVAYGNALKGGIQTNVKSTLGKELLGTLEASLPDGYKIFRDAGGNWSIGLADGVKENQSVIDEGLKTLGKDTKLATLTALDEHSPSTFTKEAGKNWVYGMNNGIEENAPSTLTAISAWISSIKESLPVDMWADAFANILPAFQTKWAELTEWWSAVALPELFASMNDGFFSVDSWLTVFDNIRLALVQKFEEMTLWLNEEALPTWWTDCIEMWFAVEKWLDILDNVRIAHDEKWKEIFELVQKMLLLILEEMKKKQETMSDNWRRTMVLMVEVAHNAFETIRNDAESAIDAIIDKIGELSGALSGISGKFSNIGGMSSGVSAYYRSGVAPSSYMLSSIPHLATGAVIRGGNPFMAVLGDQPSGQTNIEAPLSTIREAVREELSGMNFGGQTQIVLRLNGQDVGEAIVEDLLSVMNRKGYDVEVLGVT